MDKTNHSNKYQKKGKPLSPKKDQGKLKKKFKRHCYVCEKMGQYERDCRHRKKSKKEKNVNSFENIVVTVREINTIQSKILGWRYDTCSTIHVCIISHYSKHIMTL